MNVHYYVIIQPDGSFVYSRKIEYTFWERNQTVFYIVQVLGILYFTGPLITITVLFILLV
jgi:hypothetical protein